MKYNPAYLINLFTNLIAVLFAGFIDFSLWVIPVEALWIVCIVAFFTAAGLDSFAKKFIKLLGIVDTIMLKTRGIQY